MNCREIIYKYLKENKFDGLFNCEIQCGCSINDIAPCESFSIMNCQPAYENKNADCKNCNSPCESYDESRNITCYTIKKK